MKSRLATSIRCSFLHMNLGGRILVSTLLAVIVTAAAGAQSAPAVSRSAPWAIKILSCAPTPLLLATIFTNRSGCEKGSERNKTAFTMLKLAVFAPTPKARESTATMVNAGLFQSSRSPYRTS